MRTTYSILICLLPLLSHAQDGYQMKGNADETTADFLSSYYHQDGDNAAVTGGIGTEKLTDVANLFVVNVPIDSVQAIDFTAGADNYSSASTDNINSIVSSASSRDTRVYAHLGYTRKNLKKGQTYGARIGFSREFDYTSFNFGFSWAKEWNEGNSELSLNAQAFIDRWRLIFPAEIRSRVRGTISSPNRQSFNFQATYSQVINRRLQMSVSGETVYMNGLLSTPFHRVYFADQTRPDIERLPNSRLKIPLGLRVNYFPFDNFVMRSYYRFYWDDFGIVAHTASIETPVKLGSSFTVSPFYRYHTQTAADYFAPFSAHLSTEEFYTSDHDLSGLDSHKIGIGIKYAPLYGIGRAKISSGKKLLKFESVHMRGAYYKRSTGLHSFVVSLDLAFKIK
ncbi:MAG TPA: DUF3570 domain-containing protein [Bacteroidetes bacterium]|nr:DUF3570 domain-containing protein [Bacteroidota bacterium]